MIYEFVLIHVCLFTTVCTSPPVFLIVAYTAVICLDNLRMKREFLAVFTVHVCICCMFA